MFLSAWRYVTNFDLNVKFKSIVTILVYICWVVWRLNYDGEGASIEFTPRWVVAAVHYHGCLVGVSLGGRCKEVGMESGGQ
ncbi:hypothetical protein HanRHA438_Chr12g0552031 [Helianthus annuus]|nr:hypothetical protein HanRHA438_Chr12g0552031 [Helianthus annuus]